MDQTVTTFSYLLQTAILGGIMGLLSQRLRDEYTKHVGVLFSCFWILATAGIFLKLGDEQAIFYSSDQIHHLNSILKLRISGLSMEPSAVLGYRYVISIPATLLNLLGIHPLLAFKFLQGTCVLILLSVSTDWAKSQIGYMPRWGYLLIIGPSLMLNSVLALRDTALATAAVVTMFHPRWQIRIVAAVAVLGLRPQMLVALLFGTVLGYAIQACGPIIRAVAGLAGFLAGRVLFEIASDTYARSSNLFLADLFTQTGIARLLLSIVGMQFLSVNPDTVNLEFRELFILRAIFFDTWLIPLSFTIFYLVGSAQHRGKRQLLNALAISFCIYIGIGSQTDFSSSRQSMPFFASMGLVLIIVLAGYDQGRVAKSSSVHDLNF